MDDASGARGMAAFDEAAFLERLAELNPWLREPEEQQRTLRRAATHARFAEGKAAWNAWAEKMLAERACLEAAGEWAVDRDVFGQFRPTNDTTKLWLALASAYFSSGGDPHKFGGAVNFAGFVFPGPAEFREATFSGPANFKEATFSGVLWFNQATFSGVLWFNQATFSGDAWFYQATFSGAAWFDRAKFSGDAWFNQATFSGAADFDQATFSGDADFDQATFSGDTWFNQATFSGAAEFDRAKFSGDADFDHATFSGDADFHWATFSGDAWFPQAHFLGYAGFDNALFKGIAGFMAMEGKSFFSLRNVTFEQVPDFEQAHFSEAPRLDASTFPRAGVRPKVKKGKDDKKPERLTGLVETARWRALKRLASQAHDHEREQLFFAYELQSLRGVTDFPVGSNAARYWFGRFYEWFSDFGRSMLRPLLWWGGFTVLFALFYLGEHLGRAGPNAPGSLIGWATGWDITWPDAVALPLPTLARAKEATSLACVVGGADGTTPVSAALAASLRKGLLFAGLGETDKASQDFACLYGLDRKLMAEVGNQQLVRLVPDSVAYAGLAQTIISAVLLFLFLLAMRNQFRIR